MPPRLSLDPSSRSVDVDIRSLPVADAREVAILLGLPELVSLSRAEIRQHLEAHVQAATFPRALLDEQRAYHAALTDAALTSLPPGEEGKSESNEPADPTPPVPLSVDLTALLARIQQYKVHTAALRASRLQAPPPILPPGTRSSSAAVQADGRTADVSPTRQRQFAERLAKERADERVNRETEMEQEYQQYKRTALRAPSDPSLGPPADGSRTDPTLDAALPSADGAAQTRILASMAALMERTLSHASTGKPPLRSGTVPSPPIPVCLDDPDVVVGVARAPFDATVLSSIREGTQSDMHKLLQPLAARPSDMPDHALVLDSTTNTFRAHVRTAKPVVTSLVDLYEAHLTEIRLLAHPELIPDRIAFLRRLTCIARARGPAAAIDYARLVRATRLQRPEAATSVAARVLDGHQADAFTHVCTAHPPIAASGSLYDSPSASAAASSHAGGSSSKGTPRSQVCYNWNAGNKCARGTECSYAHHCSHCHTPDHRRKDCRVAPGPGDTPRRSPSKPKTRRNHAEGAKASGEPDD
jgi:hypothetical protein